MKMYNYLIYIPCKDGTTKTEHGIAIVKKVPGTDRFRVKHDFYLDIGDTKNRTIEVKSVSPYIAIKKAMLNDLCGLDLKKEYISLFVVTL